VNLSDLLSECSTIIGYLPSLHNEYVVRCICFPLVRTRKIVITSAMQMLFAVLVGIVPVVCMCRDT